MGSFLTNKSPKIPGALNTVRFGGNDFTGPFSVPLAFNGRYFVIEHTLPKPLISVLVEHDGAVLKEVFRNEPCSNPLTSVTKTPPGIVTVCDKNGFLYKIRPESETTVTFGTLKGEIVAKVTDRAIQVGGVHVENCKFVGVMAGVVLEKNGSIGIGAPIPKLFLKKT